MLTMSNGQINEFEEVQAELMLILYDANLLNKFDNGHVQDLNKEINTADINQPAKNMSNNYLVKKVHSNKEKNEKSSNSKTNSSKEETECK